MNLHYNNVFVKKDGKLYTKNASHKAAYELFVASLDEGAEVEMYMNVQKDDGTLAQIAKIHVMIRTLANHCGETFEDMKLLVKEKAGLILKANDQIIVKSFGKCDKEELSLVIKSCIHIGEQVNCLVD